MPEISFWGPTRLPPFLRAARSYDTLESLGREALAPRSDSMDSCGGSREKPQ